LLREKRSRNINQNIINMNKKLWVLFAGFMLVFGAGCHRESNNTKLLEKGKSQTYVLQLLQQIDSLSNMGEFNSDIAKEYVVKVEEFCNEYPEDNMAAEFLYRAGLMAMTVAKASELQGEIDFYSQKALSVFEDIQQIYPDFSGVKNCILNKGVVYDDILHDYKNAEIHYKEFIARYPTDTLSINLESYLQYLGKSPEEIMLEIEKNKRNL